MPSMNEEGYRASNVMAHVPSMRGRLMLVHGLIDENVHVRNTWRLINALIRHDKDYDLLAFPDERHLPRDPQSKAYMESRIAAFFHAALRT